MTKFMSLFDGVERDKAQKVLDFYEGKSEQHLRDFLTANRRNAMDRGLKPRTRNLTRDIIDKSGMLFAGRAPVIKVFNKGSSDVNDAATEAAINVFENADWIEVFNNFDPLVRMMKSAIIFPQYDPEDQRIIFTMLSQANAAAHFTPTGKIDTLLYFVGKNTDAEDVYALVTAENYQTLTVTNGGGEILSDLQPNPYGMVPYAMFHDTNIPMKTGWNTIPMELVTVNEMYNIHISDSEYAGAWSKMQTLYTNADIQGDSVSGAMHFEDYGSKLGERLVRGYGAGAYIGGPGQAVAIDGDGKDIYLEYKGPNPDLKTFDDVVKGWVRDYARDWSVSVGDDISGGADSGFKLMVKEIPNMELRKKRQRMMEAGFKRLYEVLLQMSDAVGLGLVQGTELFVEFSAPEMPVDEQTTEQVWSMRFKQGTATIIDYFMVQKGMSRDEAYEAYTQMIEDRNFIKSLETPAPAVPAAANVPAEEVPINPGTQQPDPLETTVVNI